MDVIEVLWKLAVINAFMKILGRGNEQIVKVIFTRSSYCTEQNTAEISFSTINFSTATLYEYDRINVSDASISYALG